MKRIGVFLIALSILLSTAVASRAFDINGMTVSGSQGVKRDRVTARNGDFDSYGFTMWLDGRGSRGALAGAGKGWRAMAAGVATKTPRASISRTSHRTRPR